MALQINKALTTKSGLPIPSGSYVWLLINYGIDLKYRIECRLFFYKDKATFLANPHRVDPAEIADTKKYYNVEFPVLEFAAMTPMLVHELIRDELNAALGEDCVIIVE